MKARSLSMNKIIEEFDKYDKRLSVVSYRRNNKMKIMSSKNLNILEAFKEISLRNTIETFSMITIDLPEDIDLNNFNEVKKYQLNIDNFWFGTKPKKSLSYIK